MWYLLIYSALKDIWPTLTKPVLSHGKTSSRRLAWDANGGQVTLTFNPVGALIWQKANFLTALEICGVHTFTLKLMWVIEGKWGWMSHFHFFSSPDSFKVKSGMTVPFAVHVWWFSNNRGARSPLPRCFVKLFSSMPMATLPARLAGWPSDSEQASLSMWRSDRRFRWVIDPLLSGSKQADRHPTTCWPLKLVHVRVWEYLFDLHT